jgi:uncharacterized protein (DUF697 family)
MSWFDTLAEIRKKNWSEAPDEERRKAARDVVMMSSYAGAAASVVPIPLAEMAILIPIHTTMLMTIGHVFGRPITKTEAKRVVLELGAVAGLSLAGRAAVSALKKLVMPALGGVIAAPMTFAITWGLGQVSIAYFQNPHLSRDELKKIFQDAVREGKEAFSMETLDRFRQKEDSSEPAAPNGEEAVAGESAPTDPAPPVPPAEQKPDGSESLRPKKRSM